MPRANEDRERIMVIEASIEGRGYKCDIDSDLLINPSDLDNELIEQPGRFAWYGALAEYAMDRYQREKAELERVLSELDKEVREKAAASNEKVTEAVVTSRIKMDSRYLTQQDNMHNAGLTYRLLLVAKEAFSQRKDMLMELGRRQAAEGASLKGVRRLNEEVASRLDEVRKSRTQE